MISRVMRRGGGGGEGTGEGTRVFRSVTKTQDAKNQIMPFCDIMYGVKFAGGAVDWGSDGRLFLRS